MFRERPRWQTKVIRPVVRRFPADWSQERRHQWEVIARRLLGQPLSAHSWHRMTFNDKVLYRGLCDRDERFAIFCDKLRMRHYVTGLLGSEVVPRLLRVGEQASEFKDLDGPFVLKANHGSNWVTVVGPGASLSEHQLEEAQRWVETDYWSTAANGCSEWGYRDARRLLLAEELLPGPPDDCKLLVFGGHTAVVQVDTGRFGERRRALMSPDWSRIVGRLRFPLPDGAVPKPPNLDTMIEWASVLGGDLDFLRVDCYDLGDRVLVGELTPYPGGGIAPFRPKELDRELGALWRLKR